MATIDSNLIISRLAVQGNTGYVMFEVGLSESCNWQTVYIDPLTDGGKAMYATAMSAHLSDKSLARIEYSRTGGICNASLIEI